MFILLKKYWYVVALAVVYYCYATFVLSPLKFNSFSLIDDGQSLQNSIYFDDCFINFKCENLKNVLIEKQFGRFRPLYWTFQYFEFKAFGLNASLHHAYRIYFLGLIILLLMSSIIIRIGGGAIALILSAFLFFGSYSYTENIIRLGPVEPYQIIFLSLFSLIYLNTRGNKKNKYSLILFILAVGAILIKETSFIVIFPLLLTTFNSKFKNINRASVFISLGCILLLIFGRIIARPIPGSLVYVDNFNLNVFRIISGLNSYLQILLNSTSPFVKLSLISLPLLVFSSKFREKIVNKPFYFWFFMTIFSMGILLPWKFILERYILLTLFSFSIMLGYVFDKLIEHLRVDVLLGPKLIYRLFYYFILFLSFTNLFFYGFSINLAKTLNFTSWYENYLIFEKDQVEAISKNRDKTVYINAKDNLDNWEVLFEIPIHLKLINKSNTKVVLMTDTLPENSIVFSRQPFDSVIDLKNISGSGSLENSRSYSIKQIDPIEFRKEFILRPYTTVNHPPYLKNKITYYWEIRKI